MENIFNKLMKKLMISCEKASFLASKSQDKRLTVKEKASLKMHLTGCSVCRNYKKDLDILTEYLRNYKYYAEDERYQIRLSPEQRKRIKDLMKNREK